LAIGEVECDPVGREVDTGGDAAIDGEVLVVVVFVGLGFEVIEDRVEGVGGGKGIVLGEEAIEEPVAIGAGADGEDVVAAGGEAKADEGLSVGGGKGEPLLGDGEQGCEGR